jgi:hypothetical protein
LLIDAVRLDCDLPQRAIIHGDALSASIAAASILAKVERDRMMCEWDAVFPEYGLARTRATARRSIWRLCANRPDAAAPAVVRSGVEQPRGAGRVRVR